MEKPFAFGVAVLEEARVSQVAATHELCSAHCAQVGVPAEDVERARREQLVSIRLEEQELLTSLAQELSRAQAAKEEQEESSENRIQQFSQVAEAAGVHEAAGVRKSSAALEVGEVEP